MAATTTFTSSKTPVHIQSLCRIRTITAYTYLTPEDFTPINSTTTNTHSPNTTNTIISNIQSKINDCSKILRLVERTLRNEGYEIQTLRIATNPFGQWLFSHQQLTQLNDALHENHIEFCALGPATNSEQVKEWCETIVLSSHRFSCSAELKSSGGCSDDDDFEMMDAIAECMQRISKLGDLYPDVFYVQNGLGNFRFCSTACCDAYIPFFPAAKAPSIPLFLEPSSSSTSSPSDTSHSTIPFAIGLENGQLANYLLSQTKSIQNISTIFKKGMLDAIQPIHEICKSISISSQSNPTITTSITTASSSSSSTKTATISAQFVGMDTSLNPSLDENGSIAQAMEQIHPLKTFGDFGSLAVAAEITKCLQSLGSSSNGEIQTVGYCGLMLPVCEDQRLASLASDSSFDKNGRRRRRRLDIRDLLSISSVCGVGLDTIPLSGSISKEDLICIIADVAGLAHKWKKPLSCRLLPCPNLQEGDVAKFGSPYMCDCRIFDV